MVDIGEFLDYGKRLYEKANLEDKKYPTELMMLLEAIKKIEDLEKRIEELEK